MSVAADQTLYAHWKVLEEIPADVFDFGAQESYTYSNGQSQDVLFDFIPAADAAYRQSDFIFKYMRQGSTMYESGQPINAGTYNVTISRRRTTHTPSSSRPIQRSSPLIRRYEIWV